MAYLNSSISVHPEVQGGMPVFSGTCIPVETFVDYLRIGVHVNEFLDEFPSITRDQAQEVYAWLQDAQPEVARFSHLVQVQPGASRG